MRMLPAVTSSPCAPCFFKYHTRASSSCASPPRSAPPRILPPAPVGPSSAAPRRPQFGVGPHPASPHLSSSVPRAGNLQLCITNVHIRYEDNTTNPGQPFACGATLDRVSAYTVDEAGREAFVTNNPLEILRKASAGHGREWGWVGGAWEERA